MRLYSEGSIKAQENWISERYREAVVSSDPEAGKPISIPIEVYATYNPVAPEHEPRCMGDWILKEL